MDSEVLNEAIERHPLVSLVSACFWVIRECCYHYPFAYGTLKLTFEEHSMAFVMDKIANCICYDFYPSAHLCGLVILNDAYGRSLFRLGQPRVPAHHVALYHGVVGLLELRSDIYTVRNCFKLLD